MLTPPSPIVSLLLVWNINAFLLVSACNTSAHEMSKGELHEVILDLAASSLDEGVVSEVV